MKNFIKTIALAGIFCMLQVNTGPFEKLGLTIKTMAQSYGLHCKYPVTIQKNLFNQRNFHAGTDSNIDVITNTAHNHNILFDADFVEKQLEAEPKLLVAILFHENAHLDLDHKRKALGHLEESSKGLRDSCLRKVKLELKNIIDPIRPVLEEELKHCTSQEERALALGKVDIQLSPENPVMIALQDKILKEFEEETGKAVSRLSRLHEEEADRSVSQHADLCLSLSKYLYRPADDLTNLMLTKSPLTRETLFLYRKACNQNIEAYTSLEETIDTKHPLSVRRSLYLLDMAKKAPVQGSYIQHYWQWAKAQINIQRDLFLIERFWKV